ncbi:MAG: hypothetical protein ACTSPY_02985 [Candidatus Helarchaeota archaeon]
MDQNGLNNNKKKKKKKEIDFDSNDSDTIKFESILRDTNINQIDDLIDKMINVISDNKIPFKKDEKGGTYVWGFSLTMTPDKKPIFREFGNIKSDKEGLKIQENWDPLIEILENDSELLIITEIPGGAEDKIKLYSTENSCKLYVDGIKTYQKTIEFPFQVDPATEKVRYKNGILEISYLKK